MLTGGELKMPLFRKVEMNKFIEKSGLEASFCPIQPKEGENSWGSKCVGIIYKVRSYLTLNIWKCLCYSLIYSYLSYCTVSWESTYPTKLNCLLLLQKRVLRIITLSGWWDHSRPLFTRFGILNIYCNLVIKNIFLITKFQIDELVCKASK